MINKELLDIMACPLCKSDIALKEDKICCTNSECGCVFNIVNDIPVMLIDEAQRLCPSCKTQREWIEAENTIRCPNCKSSFSPIK